MVGIYAIKNKINNKIYIGRSTELEEIVRLRYKEKLSYQKIADIYDKNRKTIERIFTNVYYKEEMEKLKKLKPELFQS